MDVLSSRILVRPSDLDRSRRFYRDVLGLAIYREFGPPDDPGMVFFPGQGLLEVSGHAAGPPGRSVMIWIQVRDMRAEHARLAAAAARIIGEPATEPWGLIEMVFTQLAKRAVRACGGGGQDAADLNPVVGDDHPVDEQFGQLPSLRERGRGKSGP